MIIRDYQDYQEVSNCDKGINFCCRYPGADLNDISIYCDRVQGSGRIDGHIKEGDTTGEYKVLEVKYSDAPYFNPPETGHITTYSYNEIITASVRVIDEGGDRNVLLTPPQVSTITESGGNSFDSPTTYTYSDKVTYTDGLNQIVSILNANLDYDKGVNAEYHISSIVVCQSYRFKGTESLTQEASRIKIGWSSGSLPENRKYIKLSYDIYLMSENYRSYLYALNTYNIQKKQHDDWLECELQTPGHCGPEPYNPTPPTEPTPLPQFITHTEWESVNGLPDSAPPFELPVVELAGYFGSPEYKAQNNVYVINNIQASSYRSSRVGGVPTSFNHIEDYPID